MNCAADRVAVLHALSCVDIAVVFDELTPQSLIAAVRPDVYVKGGDYTIGDLPERPQVEAYGGRVEVLSFIPGHSSSAIIARLRG